MTDAQTMWRTIPLLSNVPPDEAGRYAAHLRTATLARGQTCHGSNDTAHDFTFVARGRIKLVKSDPKSTIVGLVHAGQLVCSGMPYVCGQFCCSAIADSDPTIVAALARTTMLEMVARYPLVARAFMQAQATRAQLLCSRVHEVAAGRVEQRIARLLLRLAQSFGTRTSSGQLDVEIALSRRDLAELCGTSTETAIRIMSRLERGRVVCRTERGYAVLDETALTQLLDDNPKA